MNNIILIRIILTDLSEKNFLIIIPVRSMYEFASELMDLYHTFEVEPSKISNWEYHEFRTGNNAMKLSSEEKIHETLKPFKKERYNESKDNSQSDLSRSVIG